jgi:hypothetical protein
MKIILTAACLTAFPVAALAQQPPTQTQLQESVVKKVGSFWNPTQFRIVAKQVNKSPLKPSFLVRFQLDATNIVALYVPNGKKIGPQDILVETVPAKSTRTFYGTEDLAYSAGAWTGPTTIENPADKLGKPIDLYTVPTVVLGSAQYKAAVAQQTTFSLDQQKALFQKRLNALEKADAAKAADVEKSFVTGLQGVNGSFTHKLTQQQAALTAQLGKMLTRSQQALADQQKQIAQAWAKLIAQQHDSLVKLKLGLQTTQQAVAAKIKLAQATIDSQKQLIVLQQQALANNATIASLKTKLAKMAKAQLLSFQGTWGGTLRCDQHGASYWHVRATEMKLTLSEMTGGVLNGQLMVVGGDLGDPTADYGKAGQFSMTKPIPASLQIMNANEKGPVKLEILSGGKQEVENRYLNFEVQLDPSGVLKGDAVHLPKDCLVVFSR